MMRTTTKTARRLIHLNILFIDDILDIFDENRVGTIRILNKLNTISILIHIIRHD